MNANEVLVSGEAAAELSAYENFPALNREGGEGGNVRGSGGVLPLAHLCSSEFLCMCISGTYLERGDAAGSG